MALKRVTYTRPSRLNGYLDEEEGVGIVKKLRQ
jgi:hypothetical protein